MSEDVRVKRANREQMCLDVLDYDQLLPADHPCRLIVRFVDHLNLEAFYEEIKSREGSAGRASTDPKLLLCLWIYATIEGIGSARFLEKLCVRDNAFRWLCGGVRMNYHTLSDFRTKNGDRLDNLLTEIVSLFVAQNAVHLESIAVDGTKVKASASKKSYKTRKKLNELKRQTQIRVKALRQECVDDTGASERRYQASRKRAIEEMDAKVNQALTAMPAIEAAKETAKKKVKKGKIVSSAKTSLTDPDARLMKFSDKSVKGGYNCQIAIDPNSQMVLSVEVSQEGNDKGLLKPMVAAIETRYQTRPLRAFIDTGYQVQQEIVDLAEDPKGAVLVYSPLLKKKTNIKAESLRKREKKEENYPGPMKNFVKRMTNKSAQKFYKVRSKIETVNGILHNRMPFGFRLRGKIKVKSELLLQVIAHNIFCGYRIGVVT